MVLICKSCFSRIDGEIDENAGIVQCIICGNIIEAGKLKSNLMKQKETRKKVEIILARKLTKDDIRYFNYYKFTMNDAVIWANDVHFKKEKHRDKC